MELPTRSIPSRALGVSATGGATTESSNAHIYEEDARFSCNVCLDPVKDPVVTQCGHLYCWPCLYRWLKTHHTTCPVCKSGVTEEAVIPIYIRGSEQDPRSKSRDAQGSADSADFLPNRPQGRRVDAATQNFGGGQGQGMQALFGGMTISTSYGYFPSLFGLQFQSYAYQVNPGNNRRIIDEEREQAYLSMSLYVLSALGILVLLII